MYIVAAAMYFHFYVGIGQRYHMFFEPTETFLSSKLKIAPENGG